MKYPFIHIHRGLITWSNTKTTKLPSTYKRLDICFEDDLPADISKKDYDLWFKYSKVDGVRYGISLASLINVGKIKSNLCDIKIKVIITAPEKEMKAAADAMANLNIMAERLPKGKVRNEYLAYLQSVLDLMAVIQSREE